MTGLLTAARTRRRERLSCVHAPALAFLALTSTAVAEAATFDPNVVVTLTDIVTLELSRDSRLDVLSSADLRRVVELEGERQAVGCGEEMSCLAEVAGAMGARFVVFGQLGSLGETLVLTLNVFDSESGSSAGRVIVKAGDAEALSEKLTPAISELVASIHQRVGAPEEQATVRVLVLDLAAPQGATSPAPDAPVDEPSTTLPLGTVMLMSGGGVAALGVVALGAGVGLAVLAQSTNERGVAAEFQSDAKGLYDEANQQATMANVAYALGGVVIVAGAGLVVAGLLLGDEE